MTKRLLPNWLEAYMEYVDNTEPPLLYKKWCGISALCAAMERKTYIEWELGDRIYPNMYIIIVGPSGARKSTAMSPIIKLLESLDNILIAPESATKEAIVRMMQENTQNLIIGDIMGKHSSINIIQSELVVFLGQRQNNWELISWLNDWFDCKDDWSYVTKGCGSDHVQGVWVNMLGATTPEYLISAFPVDAIGGGFSSRIIFVYADTKHKNVPIPIYTDRERELKTLLQKDLANINILSGKFKITPQYYDIYAEWYTQQCQSPKFIDRNFAGYESRRSLHLRKITMAISISKSSDMILTERDFHEGLILLDEVEDNMRFVFNGRGKDPMAVVGKAMLEDIIARKEGIKRDELLNLHFNDTSISDFNAAISKFKEAQLVVEIGSGNSITYKFVKKEDR